MLATTRLDDLPTQEFREGRKEESKKTKMSIQTRVMERSFSYQGLVLADLDPGLTPEQIRDAYSASYPEISNATIEGPETTADGTLCYRFRRAIGTKG